MGLTTLRGFLIMVAAGLLSGPAFGQAAEKQPTAETTSTILFVCEHGAAKSVIAAAYFNKLARERRLNYQAISRGTNPDPTLLPAAEKGLKEDGLDVSGWKPQLVSKSDTDKASRIVTFGCTLPEPGNVAAKVTDWNDIPSPSQNYDLARDEIRQRVQKLVESLAQNTERPIRMKDLPLAVQATVREQSKGATIRGLAEEVENGQTFYEVSLRVKGHSRDVLMDASGNVVETEEQVTLASLPPAARAEIVKQAGKGKILLVESITKNNVIVAYEAHVKTAGKISEIKVDPEGNPLAP